jgi:resuscitation-promoting factor RpfB
VARHTAERGTAAPLTDTTPLTGVPAPGTRRAMRLAETQGAAGHEGPGGSLGLPRLAVKAMRGGVLGAVVLGTGAFTVTQVSAQPGVTDEADRAAVEAGTLALRDGDASSRSQLAGRLALEADGARTFSVSVDGETREVTTTAATLGEALTEAGIVVGADDVVTASLNAAVPAGQTVEVLRATSEHVTEETVEEHGVVEKKDDSLPEGERKVETEGVDGVTTSTYRVVSAGGEEVSRELVATVVSSTKVDEVVRVGTKVAAPEPAAAEEAAAPAASYSGDPRAIGRELAAARGWGADQFSCLDSLWTRESNWSVTADNPTSSAYGIPQALPGSKMASAGADWATNPATQITWGLDYIAGRYGTPCGAWGHSQSVGWY